MLDAFARGIGSRGRVGERLVIDEATIVEWYDGFVSGFVQSTTDGMFVVALLAWDLDAGKRRYALVPTTHSEVPGADLRTIQEIFREALRKLPTSNRTLYLTSDMPAVHETLDAAVATPAEIERLDKITFPTIDAAVKRGAHVSWL